MLKVPKIEIESFKSDHGKALTNIYNYTLKDMIEKIEDNGFL